jgi:ATP-dependent helicase/nuclease subunit B
LLWSAPHPEDEAWAVAQQVLRWREEGLHRIAIVALDRAVSRRVWSQLLHCGVAVRDDTGWLLSTSRLATSWHDGLSVWLQDASADELLSWFAHPAVYAHEPTTKPLLLRYLKDVALRQDVVLKGWQNWQREVRRCLPTKPLSDEADALACDVQGLALDFLTKALTAKKQLSRSRQLNEWADVFTDWAKDFGLWQGWQTEEAGDAGAVWLQMLQLWRVDETAVLLDLAAVMRVMNAQVEQATFRAHDASDEVLLLPLGSTRMREFDAVWVLGADETHLPAPSESAGLLNTAVRMKLGLPNVVASQEQVRRDFMDLLVSTPRVFGSFCEMTNGQPNAPSSWWRQWLRASGQNVQRLQLDWRECAAQTASASTAVLSQYLPDTVSASDLNQLSACPYQYYVQRGLGIRERALPTEDVSPAMIGNLWHAVLARFHEQRGALDDVLALEHIVDEQLSPLCAVNPRYWVVRENFMSWIDAYVAWWHSREQQGWRVSASELAISVAHDSFDELLGDTGLSLKWKGKLDQLDTREQFDELTGIRELEAAVIDYKTNELAAVREKFLKPIKRGDDIQLAFYIHLLHGYNQHTVVQAGYVGVSKLTVSDAQKPHEGSNTYPQAWLNQDNTGDAMVIEQAAAQLHQQVGETFTRMMKGEPLLAMGELRACACCAVRGVCRKGYTKPAGVD